ncbi:MAG TPA: hypothetical protein VFB22_03855 [Candidatus Baltobacteraceae bacterium]|nr:hypothetical protein [Candidatus Baltobacteraceae bacterium]
MIDRRRLKTLFDVVALVRSMRVGTLGPIEGSRALVRAWPGAPDDAALAPFVAIDSESDDIVVGDRALWAAEYLRRVDRKYERYEARLRGSIGAECDAVLAVLEPMLLECPACGFGPLSQPAYDAAGAPSYRACPCCEFEPGVTDEVGYDAGTWRDRWVAAGMPFRRPPPPPAWNPEEQLRRPEF